MRHAFPGTARLLPLLALLPVASVLAAEAPGRFTGSPSCATSLCHGGAGELRHQTTVWQKHDIHSRTYNTLVNARSAQIAAALKLPEAITSARCTTCHAPFHEVPRSAFLAEITKPTEGVSCESCHGPAEPWIRSHTRPDFSHKDRVLLGLRDLNHLYVRANSCVACHQTVEPALLAAGHPELLFELDGQAVSQPKHWREKGDWHGPKAWLVGQAVALREMSAQLTTEKSPSEKLTAPWSASLWLLQQLDGLDSALPALKSAANAAQAHPAADTLARRAAELEWSHDLTRQALQRLAKTHTEFAGAQIPPRPASPPRRTPRPRPRPPHRPAGQSRAGETGTGLEGTVCARAVPAGLRAGEVRQVPRKFREEALARRADATSLPDPAGSSRTPGLSHLWRGRFASSAGVAARWRTE